MPQPIDFVGLNTLASSSFDLITQILTASAHGIDLQMDGLTTWTAGVTRPYLIFDPEVNSGSTFAINLHRNGPYGFSSWQQIRTSENPLTRYDRKNSLCV